MAKAIFQYTLLIEKKSLNHGQLLSKNAHKYVNNNFGIFLLFYAPGFASDILAIIVTCVVCVLSLLFSL